MISLDAPGSAIDIDVGLASVFHPPATYGYAGSIEAETDFVALPVAVQHMALALPVALGHGQKRAQIRNSQRTYKEPHLWGIKTA